MRNTKQGFTIVELLIVVVVIAILAAITIVSFNGIQQRAQNIKTVSAARNYKILLELYFSDNNTYPTITGTGITDMCLGTIYTADPTYGPDCVITSPNAKKLALSTELNTYNKGSQPEPSTTMFTSGSTSVRGVRLSYLVDQTLDGAPKRWWLTYAISGSSSKSACPVGPVAYGNWNGGAGGSMTMTVPTDGLQGDPFGSTAVQCRVPLNI